MDAVLTGSAILGLAANIAVDLALRKGRARSARSGPHDRGSSALLALMGVLAIPGSILYLIFGDPGPERISARGGAFFVVLLILGTWLRIRSMRELGEYFTRTLVVSGGQRLVESGPYRWLRHPGYLAQLAVFISLSALFARSWIAPAAVLALMGPGYAYRIRVEERMLVSELGAIYETYQARTWRLVPGLF